MSEVGGRPSAGDPLSFALGSSSWRLSDLSPSGEKPSAPEEEDRASSPLTGTVRGSLPRPLSTSSKPQPKRPVFSTPAKLIQTASEARAEAAKKAKLAAKAKKEAQAAAKAAKAAKKAEQAAKKSAAAAKKAKKKTTSKKGSSSGPIGDSAPAEEAEVAAARPTRSLPWQ